MLLLSFLFRFCDATKDEEIQEITEITGDFSFHSSLNDPEKVSVLSAMKESVFKPKA